MIIVGAGPAGLAVAATLRQLGQRPTVLDQADAVGGSWPTRWDGLRLHTMRSFSGLPGMGIPRRYGRWVSRDNYTAYLRDYAERFNVRPELGVRVTRLDAEADGWSVQTTERDGTPVVHRAGAVVLATGYSRNPFIPDWPGRDLFSRPLVHSTGYHTAAEYAGQRVLVVGAGNSATEIAAELVGVGAEVQLSVRTPPNIIRRSTLGVPSQLIGLAMRRAPEAVMNPMVGVLRRVSVPDLTGQGLAAPKEAFTQYLRTGTVPVLDHGFVDHLRQGRITVVAAVESLTADTVRLADGRSVDPEAVIACTGFTPALEPIVGHLGVLDERGRPAVHGAKTAPHAPGLYFVGINTELSGVLHKIGLEARDVGRVLAGRSGAFPAGVNLNHAK